MKEKNYFFSLKEYLLKDLTCAKIHKTHVDGG